MGGVVCQIMVTARLRFDSVPSNPAERKAFDEQMRDVHFNPEYARAVALETDDATEVCDILGKKSWENPDRQKLLDVVNEVCGGYPSAPP